MNRGGGWKVVTVAFLLLWPLGPAFAQQLFSRTQDPLAGSRLFGAKGCSKCHAVNGVGGNVGPDLGRILHPRSFYDLAAAMWNHFPQMAERMRELGISRPRLDPRETGDLIAFLFTLNYFDPPGDVEAGRRLFTEKKCVGCHQVGGIGGVVGPNLDFLKQYGSPIFIAAAMWSHGPRMAEAMRARGITRPTFSGSELLDLIAYLGAASPAPVQGPLYILPGRADEGRRLFVETRCIECHSVGGRGGQVGPDLAGRELDRSLTEFAAAMWNKAPAMMKAMKARKISVPQLLPEDMADVLAYLYSVRYFGEPGDPGEGQAVVTDKGCLGCHSVSGKGGKVGPDLARAKGLDSPAGVITEMWNHAGKMEEKMLEENVTWPVLKGEEMADLVAFLRALGRTR
ncbi:MAG: c-type cytochrome [Candidatus Methylomirabilia bacterium]